MLNGRRALAPWIAAVFLVLLHAVLAWQGRAFGITTGNDDASYLLLSRELRHLDYTDHYLLGAPPHSQYPPGFPAFLAGLSVLFGERFGVLQGAIILCSVTALALLYDAARRAGGTAIGLTVLALCAVNPPLVKHAGMLMSEIPYLLATAVVVWAVVREREDGDAARPPRRLWATLAIAGAIVAALTRAFGLTILGALFMTWLLERRFRRVAALSIAGALSAGAWIVWTIVAPAKVVGRSYIADATFAGERQQSLAAALIERVTTNIPFYFTRSIPSSLPQPTLEGTTIDNVVGLVVVLVLLGAGVRVLWPRARIVVLYLALCAALLSVWTWKVTRFITPVIPMLLWTTMAGAFRVGDARRWLRPVPYVVAVVILCTAIVRDAGVASAAARCDRSRARTSEGCYAGVQRGFFEAAEHARTSTADSAVFLTMKESTFGLLSDRRVLTPSRLTSPAPDSLIAELRGRGVEYAVVSPLQPVDDQRVDWLLGSCRDLRLEREFTGMTLLLRVASAGEAGPDACARLQRYVAEEGAERSRALMHGTT